MTSLETTVLSAALEAAIHATRQAGALLLSEFHSSGGPRGHGRHAEADEEAERLIRAVLIGRFPAFGYRGEETGEERLDRQGTFWLVDPNDGTSAYLKGYRGSSVSIGLIHKGIPVLGVVFAFAAPDDEGDLIAWYESGPLTRNGIVIHRPPLPQDLSPNTLVMLSEGHEHFQARSAEFVGPARFRCMPSMAYRLALVAVGEGDATLSTGGPTDWDLAAGHALVRAVGGELLDAAGNPVCYHHAFRGDVYGGSVKIAETLARRGRMRWKEVPIPTVAGLSLVKPERGAVAKGAGSLQRAQGCLLGQLAGDALGGQVEFQPTEKIAIRYPGGVRDLEDGGTWNTLAGQPTDDSEMALTLARCLVRDGRYDANAVEEAYRRWKESGPFDIGGTTSAGLQGRKIHKSQANGSLMRIAPLAIWGHTLPDKELAAIAASDSAITHPNPVCQGACQVFTVAVAHAIRSGEGPRSVYERALAFAQEARVELSVLAALEDAEQGPPADFQRNMGWVLIALRNAFHQLLHAPSLEEGLVTTVGHGGDTDTNGAVAGALLGAVHGRNAVPLRWQRAILGCRPLQGQEGVRQPRPQTYWPVDALILAERLLAAGVA
ncbi:MAG: inositol monophosphatase family protein [Myxococcales bacterium]|nr:ADP-ribosylglycohydrolase family protein [Polyangiaceae bacterium]MDW8249327.1 inositol monophosphatase family protein [Myxococcales bacterium]